MPPFRGVYTIKCSAGWITQSSGAWLQWRTCVQARLILFEQLAEFSSACSNARVRGCGKEHRGKNTGLHRLWWDRVHFIHCHQVFIWHLCTAAHRQNCKQPRPAKVCPCLIKQNTRTYMTQFLCPDTKSLARALNPPVSKRRLKTFQSGPLQAPKSLPILIYQIKSTFLSTLEREKKHFHRQWSHVCVVWGVGPVWFLVLTANKLRPIPLLHWLNYIHM